MRKILLLFVPVLLCCSSGFSQHIPQWTVVQTIHLTEQTSPVDPTNIFTPTTTSLYRLEDYIACGGEISFGQGSWSVTAASENRGGITLTCGRNTGAASPYVVSPALGTPVTYAVAQTGTPKFVYNLDIVVEQLK